MDLLVIALMLLISFGGAALFTFIIGAAINGGVDGESHYSRQELGMDSYKNSYFPPFSWLYDGAYRLGKARQSEKAEARRQARIDRNQERFNERNEEQAHG